MSDQELIQKVKVGDMATFKALIKKYFKEMWVAV